MENDFKVGDEVIYCPPYVTRYSKRYEGIITELFTNKKGKKKAWCKLGFGMKDVLLSDLIKVKTI